MSFIIASSPHTHHTNQTGRVMRHVLYACLPALLCMGYFWGLGIVFNVMWCCVLAVAIEALCLKLRHKPILFYVRDYSALVTGVLLGSALPAFAPWWLSAIGVFFAIAISKHLYGGLGQNPFNPAMIAYALLLVSFPIEMTRWPTTLIDSHTAWLSFLGQSPHLDQLSGATPLDSFKTSHQITTHHFQWLWINGAFLLGGAYLLAQKIITWHIPSTFLACLTLFATLFYVIDPTMYASPWFHLSTGATMMGAFFIATDPVSAASSPQGRLLYGAGIGTLIYIIRTWGGYPDAVAFAVLLMNLCAPLIDIFVQPRTFGHDTKPITWKNKP